MENINNQYGYSISIIDYNHEKWIRVQAMNEDFIIASHDLVNTKGELMKECTQPELMERLEDLKLTTFNRTQGFVIATLIEEINAKLEEAGGDKFDEDWYASSELWKTVSNSYDYTDLMWCFSGTSGCFVNDCRCYKYFRCRPVINYNN